MNKYLVLSLLVSVLALPTLAHDAPDVPESMPRDELLTAFGWNLAEAEITVETLAENFHVLFGLGGNIAVSVGDDGVLIVDDQFPELVPAIEDAIRRVGGDGVDFAVNTHWHFDHADGNQALGPAGTWLVSQSNSRKMMQGDHIINLVAAAYKQKAYPDDALPVITFDDTMQFHFNGEQIDLVHFGPAHTTGDTATIFRGSNAVHMGDVFNNSGYPFIDAGNGGTLDGVIHFCRKVLAEINEETIVIPGHGPVTDYATLESYITMLETVRERMMSLIMEGASLDDVYAAKVTEDFDDVHGDPAGFINRAYLSLTHRVVDR